MKVKVKALIILLAVIFNLARVKGVDTWSVHDEEIQGPVKLLTITSHRLSITKNGDLSVLGKSHHPFE